jgi:hypothetical protein
MSNKIQKSLEISDDRLLVATERTMWVDEVDVTVTKMTADQINEKYEKGERRIVTESNRERLPNFVAALDAKDYMDLRPFYQRRSRWDHQRQSKLIESFIMNVPVPPVFLYERDFGSYEVMDGQQRITAISDFYTNRFSLTGLELWPELNGMQYANLPSKVKMGIDRRSISSIVLLKESAPNSEEAMLLRQVVFERLNTGGVKLERQEIRNCLYKSDFNDLLYKLSQLDSFRRAWGLPQYSSEEENITVQLPIHKETFYKKMEDTEMVLRFFALRHATHYQLGMRGFLDLYMVRATSFTKKELAELETLYKAVFTLAEAIYEDLLFRPYDVKNKKWIKSPSKAFHDSIMVGLIPMLGYSDKLIAKREEIIEQTSKLFETNIDGELTGRNNSRNDVIGRINIFSTMIEKFI